MADKLEDKLRSKTRKLVLCQHCGEEVSKRTYYLHKRLYFDPVLEQWSKTRRYNVECSTQDDPTQQHFEIDPQNVESTLVTSNEEDICSCNRPLAFIG